MKIIQVQFKNLNSLAGEWLIDFTDPEITGSGIFAITGPTGAGKSTILDAICLALYGQTPRLERISKSSNEIMTRQTGECFAEIEFLTSKGKFRCHWSQHRARRSPNGELQPQKHEIVDSETGKVLETRLRLVEKMVVEVTGLDFRQFTRSILLAQGEFNTFLKAKPDDRAPILEQITGTEVYSRISKKVHELTTAEEGRLNALQAECDGFRPLSDEQKFELDNRLSELTGEIKVIEQDIGTCRSRIKWYEELDKTAGEIDRLTTLLTQFEQQQEDALPDQIRYNRALSAQAIVKDHTQLCDTKRLQQEDTGELEKDMARSNTLATTLDREQQNYTTIGLELKKLQDQIVAEQRLFADVRRRDQEIEHLSTRHTELIREAENETKSGRQYQTSLEQLNQEFKSITTNIKAVQEYQQKYANDETLVTDFSGLMQRFNTTTQLTGELEKGLMKIQSAQTELTKQQSLEDTYRRQLLALQEKKTAQTEKHRELKNQGDALLKGTTTQQLSSRITLLGDKLTDLERLRVMTLQRNTLEEDIIKLEGEIASGESFLLRMDTDLGQLKERIHAQKDIVGKQERIVYLAATIQDYEQQRHNLEPGNPCPLCGSIEHPYTDGVMPVKGDEQRLLEQEQQELEKLQQSLTKLTADKAATHARRQQSAAIHKAKCHEHANTLQTVKQVQDRLELNGDQLTTAHLDVMSQRYSQEREDLQARLESYGSVVSQLESAAHQLNTTVQEIADTEKQLALASQQFQSLQETLAQLKQTSVELQEQRTRKTEELKTLIEPFHERSGSEDLESSIAELGKRRERWLEKAAQLTKLSSSLQHNTAAQDKYTALLSDSITKQQKFESRIHLLAGQLKEKRHERYHVFGKDNPDTREEESRKKLQEIEISTEAARTTLENRRQQYTALTERTRHLRRTIESRQANLVTLEKEFSVSLMANDFKDEKDFLASLLPDETIKSIGNRLDGLKEKIKQAETLLASHSKSLEQLKTKQPTSTPRVEIQAQLDTAVEKSALLLQEKGALDQRVQDNERLVRRHAEKIDELSRQQSEYNRWKILHDLIGSADGKKFRNFAQGLTFELVISHANRSLGKMSDRYILVRDTDEPLELQIIDNYQAGERRSIKNLSGGESFLVSLALALGLSGMASRNVRVDSLFLDEGFGTLDEESLQTALDILSGLHRDGKLIGIISHVAGLRERIPAHIQVVKGLGGRSRLTGAGTG